jgi:predicted transcriptional regulator
MSGRTSLQIKREILKILSDKKEHTFAELERKVNSNWQTIRTHCKELEIFNCLLIKEKKHHKVNNKSYFEVVITKIGIEILKKSML